METSFRRWDGVDEGKPSLEIGWHFEKMQSHWEQMGSRVKRKINGIIESYKARLLAKSYTQKERIDYDKTFSLIVRFAPISLILAIIASLDLELHQMDVKTAFFNGGLEDEIYIQQ